MPTQWLSLRRTAGLRAGVGIGVALALVGALVGTATGAVTPFQQVVVVNGSASPVPVVGTVNVGNTPANQNVTVSNFPSTQAVSGTVNVGDLPAPQVATVVWQTSDSIGNEEAKVFPFGQTINVSAMLMTNFDDDNMIISLITVAGGRINVYDGDGGMSQTFPMPVPATGIRVYCYNILVDCNASLSAVGF